MAESRSSGFFDTIAVLIFIALTGWGVARLFLPETLPQKNPPPTLRPSRIKPDMEALLKLIQTTPPAKPSPDWTPSCLSNRWQWIVIHHSGTVAGNAEAFDKYHRDVKSMENGLAYHFVIGNGNGAGDGEVSVGERWRKQLDGGHLHGDDNHIALGIGLVGDFENYLPTPKQIASLKALLNFLLETTSLPESRVAGHRQMKNQNTVCPGTYLPVEAIVRARKQ
jgi:N-acetyl-anhydromuramyl-L-alanine amidase AmpD